MSEMIEITGLWLNESQSGKKYFSGSLGGGKILIFKNEHKEEGSKQPDYRMYLAPKEKRQEDNSFQQVGNGGGAVQGHNFEDDIPF